VFILVITPIERRDVMTSEVNKEELDPTGKIL
jgi:hypothetical protein